MSPARSLLVVDDNETDREIMALTLGAAFPGAEIRRADDPFLARTACEEQEFDCVVTDFDMPGMSGVALAAELRVVAPYLPVILMSSVGDEVLAVEALRSGMSDYIPKSRLTAGSIRRAVERSISSCIQAKLIDEQRGELENFAYALAHDFKQPIRQIITFAEMISDEINSEKIGDVGQHLIFLGDAARRLGKLVDVMSQYTLLNEPPELTEIDLNSVLASVRTSLAPYIKERNAELIIPSQAPKVRGNDTLMTQVLQNLIINGLHYNHSENPRVTVTAERLSDDWVVRVSDNGIGIEAKYLTEIFKPLIRLYPASAFAGSGLGLTLARKAVLAQNGSIWCDSQPDQGSVFHVRLPQAMRPDSGKTRRRSAAQ